MGEKEMFLTRLYMELKEFRHGLLRKGRARIYASSYRIEAYVNFFNILVDLADEMPEMDYGGLIRSGDGLLESLYRQWTDYDDGAYLEMKRFVIGELKPYMGARENSAPERRAA